MIGRIILNHNKKYTPLFLSIAMMYKYLIVILRSYKTQETTIFKDKKSKSTIKKYIFRILENIHIFKMKNPKMLFHITITFILVGKIIQKR